MRSVDAFPIETKSSKERSTRGESLDEDSLLANELFPVGLRPSATG